MSNITMNFFGLCCANRNKSTAGGEGDAADIRDSDLLVNGSDRNSLIPGARPNTNYNLRLFSIFDGLLFKVF